MHEFKILISGTMGAGKTTAIAAISETPPVKTEVKNTDTAVDKATTTVGLDYGELTLDNGDKLRLFGTPGQLRFAHLWTVLAQGALGLVILVDNSRPEPLKDLSTYLAHFAPLIRDAACVVGVGRLETHPAPDLETYARHLERHGVVCPLLPVDVRERDQVVMLLDVLLTQLESKV